ncbi:MAG: elongation factor 1-beta [Thaumarchaeota archaeon]|nr:elongation factor 1-beta [Nitrososphaerota archaeon]
MDSYVVRMKVLPTGPEVPAQTLLESIKGVLEKDMVFRSSREDPIAFGLYALIIDIVTPGEEGNIDKVEAAVAKAPNVAQSDLQAVSRMSSQLKNV